MSDAIVEPTVEAPVEEAAPEAPLEAEAPVEGDVPKTEAKAEAEKPKTYKVKIDGEEVELNEQELLEHARLGKAAHKRMQEAAQMRKDFDNFLSVLKKDPAEVLKAMGMDVDDFAEKHLDSKIQEMQKSPEQKEKEQLAKELEKYKKEAETAKKAQEDALKAQLDAQAVQQIEEEITQALKDTPDLPRSPYAIKRIAEAMMVAFEKGYHDVKVKDVLPIVKKQIQSEWQEMFGQLPEDILENVIGKPNIERLRKKRLSQSKQPVTTASKVVSTGQSDSKPKQEKQEPKVKASDFFKNLGRL